MEKSELIKECGIEIAIEKISQLINEKMDEFEKTQDKNIKIEILELIHDREEIYSNNKEIIKKYFENKN